MDFAVSEFETRLERTQRAMADARLDCLFFTTEPEMRYYTGFRTLFWQSPTRPWFLIVPGQGKPIAIIPEIGAPLMARTWVDDIRTWASPHADDDGITLLVDALGDYPNIGMMMGRETSLRMPLANFTDLSARLPGCHFTDATALVRSIMMVKSPAEIEKIRTICTIASDAFDRVPDIIHPGMTLKQAFKTFKIALLEQGADDVPYLVGGAGPDGYEDVISPPDDTPLRESDILMMDTGATRDGYFCDFDRNFAFGKPSDAARRAYDRLWQATEVGISAARPGITCAELCAILAKELGGDIGQVGRIGHGLGTQLTEPPSIISHDHTPLREGMVMTIEPAIEVTTGRIMVHEENLVVTDGEPVLLTKRAPRELPVVSEA